VFAEQAHARTANGCQGAQIFRNPDDPNETIVILAWDSLVRARLYAQSDEWLESLDHGGVRDQPECWFLEEGGDCSAT
jgi:hypothetical protein